MTCKEKLAIEHPDKIHHGHIGGCACCPHTYGYLDPPEYCDHGCHGCCDYNCTECWNREIPGTENLEKEKETEKMENVTKKTKQELIEKIEELEKQVAKYDRYKQYEETADELKVVLDSFMNAGFTREEAYGLLVDMVKGTFNRI